MKDMIKIILAALMFVIAWLGSCRAIVEACDQPPESISKRVDCNTLDRAERLEHHFYEASQITGISQQVLFGLAVVESNMRAGAYSGRGDYGLMQIRCRAWLKHFRGDADVRFRKCSDLYDPRTNVIVGAKILKIEYERESAKNGDLELNALTAYKAGLKWRKNGVSPQERYRRLVIETGEWIYDQIYGEACNGREIRIDPFG